MRFVKICDMRTIFLLLIWGLFVILPDMTPTVNSKSVFSETDRREKGLVTNINLIKINEDH